MTLIALEPWIIAVCLGLLAGLCWHISGLYGDIAGLILSHLSAASVPLSALIPLAKRYRDLRRLYLALAASCGAAALCFAAIALGWA